MTRPGAQPRSTASAEPGPVEYRVAADIGGTFTDIACQVPGTGRVVTRKVPSTPSDYAEAILDGLSDILAELEVLPGSVSEVLHASTIATNAILEGKGAVTALLTTEGFRDVLELRRIRVPRLYEPLYEKPAPLVPRRRRFEVPERMGPRGEVLRPLDPDAVRSIADRLAEIGVDAVAICFLHAYANPAHEDAAAAILRAALPGCFVCTSGEVLPEIREYERTSTTVANAYIGPPVARYLRSLQDRLSAAGIGGRLLMMQSSGGTLDVERIIQTPARVVESGPAAGVIGAARFGARAGYRDLITFDMGGTTAKASLVENGRVVATDEYEVGGGISLSSRLMKGGGYALKLPVIDISEVGAGGGSVVWIDDAGALKVGPHSAGARPGPACYGAGGDEPTVTDASVVLGFLNPVALAGGTVPLHAERAGAALQRVVAKPLAIDILDAAHGVHRLANATMMRAVKAVSTYRGRDPREFALFAFGGNGGIHAAELARDLQMSRVVVPPAAGVFSALGLLHADFEVSRSRAFLRPLAASHTERLAALSGLEAEVRRELGATAGRARVERRADLRYLGQAFELPLVLGEDDGPAEIQERFEREHERTYGHRLQAEVQVVTLRVVGTVPPAAQDDSWKPAATSSPSRARRAYFGPVFGSVDTPVLARHEIGARSRTGPMIIEEYEGTTVVPPDATASLDPFGNIVIEIGRAA